MIDGMNELNKRVMDNLAKAEVAEIIRQEVEGPSTLEEKMRQDGIQTGVIPEWITTPPWDRERVDQGARVKAEDELPTQTEEEELAEVLRDLRKMQDIVDQRTRVDFAEWEEEEKPGGSTPSQYGLPEGATDLQDLIEHRKMNFAQGNIFKAQYRSGTCSHSDELRDARKTLWFAQREVARLEKLYGEG